MIRRAAVGSLLLMLLARPAPAETFEIGPEGEPPALETYIFCLALCPVGEPFAWLGGESLFKNTFWPDRIKIDTKPSGAQVQVFFRRGDNFSTTSDVAQMSLERFRGVTPIKLRAAPLFGFGKGSAYSLFFSKPGYKPLIKELRVSGSAEYVFDLEPTGGPHPEEPGG
jgi:hypothetical protein